MDISEDVRVAVEKGEEDDVDYREVQRYQQNDGLSGREQKGSIQCASEPAEEGLLTHFEWGDVALVAGLLAEVFGAPRE